MADMAAAVPVFPLANLEQHVDALRSACHESGLFYLRLDDASVCKRWSGNSNRQKWVATGNRRLLRCGGTSSRSRPLLPRAPGRLSKARAPSTQALDCAAKRDVGHEGCARERRACQRG